jgi:adenylate cyclase
MADIEIERKFLLKHRPEMAAVQIYKIRQAYIAQEEGNSVRIREKDGRFILSVKGPAEGEFSRHELEYEVPKADGEVLFSLAQGGLIEKTREIYELSGQIWELDIFEGANAGLFVAEIELKSEKEEVILPDWIGPEVTHLRQFYNANLSTQPFNKWGMSYEELLLSLMD